MIYHQKSSQEPGYITILYQTIQDITSHLILSNFRDIFETGLIFWKRKMNIISKFGPEKD